MSRASKIMEHIRWARSTGKTPREVIASAGVHIEGTPGWDDACEAIGMAIDMLEQEARQARLRPVRRMNGYAHI